MADASPSDAPETGMSDHDQAAITNNTTTEPYSPSLDATRQPGVPEGTVTKYHHTGQKIYPGVERDYWVYVPQQYNAAKPA